MPQEAYDQYRRPSTVAPASKPRNQSLAAYRTKYPAKPPNRADAARRLQGWDKDLPTAGPDEKGLATASTPRSAWAPWTNLPELIGGSATSPLQHRYQGETGSTSPRLLKTLSALRVREHAMAAILNGIAYHDSGLIPYGGTFLVFADYMRLHASVGPE